MDKTFWFGVFLGFAGNHVANYFWEYRARIQAFRDARKLVGEWIAYSITGRTIDAMPMEGAGSTFISSKPHWWSKNSGVLDVQSEDIDAATGQRRPHDGHVVLDPLFPWMATRIDRYADSNELVEQRLVISADFKTVTVFANPSVSILGPVYGKHAWRRKE